MIVVSRSILISAPRESVRLYLQDLNNAAQYEQKVDAIEVTASDTAQAEAAASGKFLGIPWKGSFKVRFTPDGGYHAEMTHGSKTAVCVFSLRPVSGGTVLTHEERYQFSLLARPVMRLFKGWLSHTLELELGVIKEEAERLNRQIALQKLESL
ncbi:MAG: SRPBCC family protein [Elusimicrobiota bacterium]